ncbi:MAG: double-strand break repair helicase AddA [Rickettsiales bacterium]
MYLFNPETCSFVSANAGSGKTSLLTNRVLGLLISGIEADKILCITFTKAAAAEMSKRILDSLASWVMADEKELKEKVSYLTDKECSAEILLRARSLFAQLIESPNSINIQTIHSFSQSLLRRFPLEANINPYFSVMDEHDVGESMAEARLRLFSNALSHDVTLKQSIDFIGGNTSEFRFNKLMNEIIKNKSKFSLFLQYSTDISEIRKKLYDFFSLPNKTDYHSLFMESFNYDENTISILRQAADILITSDSKNDQKIGDNIAYWLNSPDKRQEIIEDYIKIFLTDKSEPRKRLFTKNTAISELMKEYIVGEQRRVAKFHDDRNSLRIIEYSFNLLVITASLLADYEAIKKSHGWMDYDDLIIEANRLLSISGMSEWVLFKLDGGVDHVLVDEAQDTSPLQWQIINCLVKEFFAGEGARDKDRSLFIVGDEKQSIFSFQGADVKEFERRKKYFTDLIESSGKEFHSLDLIKSYRSTKSVLKLVDSVFVSDKARKGVTFSDKKMSHEVIRKNHTGLVELWPLFIKEEDESKASGFNSPKAKLVKHIAETIKGWIDKKEAKAGDIMILLRKRTWFADSLVRALKRRGVAVAGSDRMVLSENLAVRDLIALGEVLLLPDDDLTLASCLKSPIFNLSDDDLFELAYGRGDTTLWKKLSESKKFSASYEILCDLRAKTDFISPFELYSYLLNNLGAYSSFIGRMGEEIADPIDEFMRQIIIYEKSYPKSLQGFISWFTSGSGDVKRDMEQGRDFVRIMTVHSSKGLQSKIVILPDTLSVPSHNEQDDILWFDDIPICCPTDIHKPDKYTKCYEELKGRFLDEYRRLLYVALTRAEDRLYIYGASVKKEPSEDSWYQLVKNGMRDIATPFDTIFGQGLRIGELEKENFYEQVENNNLKTVSEESENDFSFLGRAIPAEQAPVKPITPSKLAEQMPAAISPLAGKNNFVSGKLVHLLLQYLPAQQASKRRETAAIIADKFSSLIDRQVIDKSISDVMNIVNNPEFSFLFAEGSLAEVPIVGNVELKGKIVSVSGQIDRLYIGKTDVWIIDFKSNNYPPSSPEHIPAAYIKQLNLYRLLLKKIYPDKEIHCALLWTVRARLDIVNDDLLKELG